MSLTFPIQHRALEASFERWYKEIGGYGEKGVPVVEGLIKIRSKEGEWSPLTTALLDTGAIVSLLPNEMSYSLDIGENDWIDHNFYGVIRRPECVIPTRITKINIMLEDEYGNQSPEFQIIAAFTTIKPLIPLLGMKDCLERFNMNWNWQSKNVLLSFNN